MSNNSQTCDSTIVRRSANYKPDIWDFSLLQSLSSTLTGENVERANKLMKAVGLIFNDENMTAIAQLELIDNIERLGLGYIFKYEIKNALDNIFKKKANNLHAETEQEEDLHAIALQFRLLRKHGYEVSQDVFIGFNKEKMSNATGNINDHVRGVLSLYDACYLALEGETILDEAKTFTCKHLNDIIRKDNCLSENLAKQVKRSLALPLHWRMQKQEARWYIDHISCVGEHTINHDLLELAKLDFNMVQATYQDDLKEMSRWWKDLGFGTELKFAREKLMDYFLWGIGMTSEPWYGNCRIALSKAAALATTIDDMYDVYGTLEELELFTDAVDRWDITAMKSLPNYMKICFLALYNTTNGIAYNILKDKQLDVIKYLGEAWGDLCKAHLKEANWYYNNYKPTATEYLKNASISVGGPLILVHAYFLINHEITEEGLEHLMSYPDLIRSCSAIFRLCNDFITSKADIERGDVAKFIQCYMNDNNVFEDVARERIRNLINEAWKLMNKDLIANSPQFSKPFIETVMNLIRVTNFIYHYGDNYGVQDWETNEQVCALLVDPVSLDN